MRTTSWNLTRPYALVALALLGCCANAQPQVLVLKDVFKDHFLIGTAVNRAITTSTSFRRSPEQLRQDIALVKAQVNNWLRRTK